MPYKLHPSLLIIHRLLHGWEQKINLKVSQETGKSSLREKCCILFLIVCSIVNMVLGATLSLFLFSCSYVESFKRKFASQVLG